MEPADVTRINRALNKLAKLYRAAKAHRLAELGLHPGQDVLLWVLAQERDGMTVSALAARLGVEQPTVTRSLSRMDKAGLFRREPVPADRRQVLIVLTAHGRALIGEIEQIWTDLAEATTGSLPPQEVARMVAAMERAGDGLRQVMGDSAAAVLAEG
ncbi:MarR family winged helix-turn-helix transcriptional regulator [Micromonospora zhanjiangensis]|uniref:MarR family winged helix-turn-helix transcriptional regulator n=1 Tax=Micromonospora zhanjiangensis TaxID=1522057 RepID=A0ABV8KIE6_9ACTN